MYACIYALIVTCVPSSIHSSSSRTNVCSYVVSFHFSPHHCFPIFLTLLGGVSHSR